MFKKRIFALMVALTLCTSAVLAGCNKDKTPKDDNGNESKTQYSVVFSKPSYVLDRFESIDLIAVVKKDDGTQVFDASLAWSVEGSSVTVDSNGRIFAAELGLSTVTATHTDSEKTGSCEINVVAGAVPFIETNAHELVLSPNHEFLVTAYVSFKGQSLASDFALSSSNSTVLTASGMTIKALSEGSAIVTISTAWRGVQLSETFSVEVKNTSQLMWASTEIIKLNPNNLVDTPIPNLVYLKNGITTPISDTSNITYSFIDADGKDISSQSPLQFDGNIMKAKQGFPATDITMFIKASYAPSGGNPVFTAQSIKVAIQYDTIVLSQIIDAELGYDITQEGSARATEISYKLDFSKIKSAIEQLGVDISSYEISKIVDRNNSNQIENESELSYGIKDLNVYSSQGIVYECSVRFVSLIIKNAADLDKMGEMLNASKVIDGRMRLKEASTNETQGGVARTFTDGYFILGSDINYNNASYNKAPEMVVARQGGEFSARTARFSSEARNSHLNGYGFEGTFDGRGYTIYNIKLTSAKLDSTIGTDIGVEALDTGTQTGAYSLSRTGLFTAIAGKGVVKNIAIHAKKLGNFGTNGNADSPSRYFGGLAYDVFGTVQNVCFVIDEVAVHAFSGIVSTQTTVANAAKLHNIAVYVNSYTKYSPINERAGLLVGHTLSAVDSAHIYYVQNGEMQTSGSGVILTSTWNQNGGDGASFDNLFVPAKDPARKVHRYNSIADFLSGTSVTYSASEPTYVEYTAMPLISDFGEYWATSDGDFDYTYGVMLFATTKALLDSGSIDTLSHL